MARNVSPSRQRGLGSQADSLASQAELLLQELRGKRMEFSTPVGAVSTPTIRTGSPYRVRPSPMINSMPPIVDPLIVSPIGPITSIPVVPADEVLIERERSNIQLDEARRRIDQLLAQLDSSMETQRLMSARLDETRKRAEQYEGLKEENHRLILDNERMVRELAMAPGNKAAMEILIKDKQLLAQRVEEAEAKLRDESASINERIKSEVDRILMAERESMTELQEKLNSQLAASQNAELSAKQLKSAEERITILEGELQSARENYRTMKSSLDMSAHEKQMELDELRQSLARAQKESQDLQTRLEKETRDLQNRSQKENEDLQSRSQKEYEDLQSRYQKEIQDLQGRLQKSESSTVDERNGFQKQLDSLLSQLTKQREKEVDLINTKALLEGEQKQLKAETGRLQQLLSNLEKRFSDEQIAADKRLRQEQESADNMRDSLYAKIDESNKARMVIKDEDTKVFKELEKELRLEITRLRDELRNGETQADSLRRQIDNQRHNFEGSSRGTQAEPDYAVKSTQAELDDEVTQEELKVLRDALERLKSELSGKTNLLKDVSEKELDLSKQADRDNEKIQELLELTRSLKQRINDMEKENSSRVWSNQPQQQSQQPQQMYTRQYEAPPVEVEVVSESLPCGPLEEMCPPQRGLCGPSPGMQQRMAMQRNMGMLSLDRIQPQMSHITRQSPRGYGMDDCCRMPSY